MQALSNTLVLPRDQIKHRFRHWEKFSSSIPSTHLPKATFSPGKFQPRLYKAGHHSSPALPGSLLCSEQQC